jgi:hypothetical protein
MKRTVKSSEIPFAVFRPTAENWCVSKCDVEKVHFEWNIQQFFLIEDQVTKSVEFQDKKRPSQVKKYLECT